MNIVSGTKKTETSKYAVFAAGCFWGVEHIFRKHFAVPSQLVDVRVGYANGDDSIHGPTYKQVCTGETKFAEAVLISYEPSTVSFKQLVEFFFRIHDPTTANAQGPDVGTQYRSGVFTLDAEQDAIARDVRDHMQKEWYKNTPIVTVVEGLRTFYDAETYHQLYLDKNTDGYTCPTHFLREKPSN